MLLRPDGLSAEQTTQPMPGAHVKAFLEFERLCQFYDLSFGLYCNECRERGMADGVRGNNATTDRTYVIECGHRTLTWTSGANHG